MLTGAWLRGSLVAFAASAFLSIFFQQLTYVVVGIAFGVCWFRARHRADPAPLPPVPLLTWAAVIGVLALVTGLRGHSPQHLWSYLLLPLLIAAFHLRRDALNPVLKAFVGSAIFISAYAVIQALTGTNVLRLSSDPSLTPWLGDRLYKASGLFGYNIWLGISLIPAWFIALWLRDPGMQPDGAGARFWRFVPLPLITLGIFASGAKTAFLALGLGVVTWLALRAIRSRRLALVMIAVAGLSPLLAIAFSVVVPRKVPPSITARHYIWKTCWQVAADDRLLGAGIGQLRERALARVKQDNQVFAAAGHWYLKIDQRQPVLVSFGRCHNQWLTMLVEGGALTLLLWVLLLAATVWRVSGFASPTARAICGAMLVALIVACYAEEPVSRSNMRYVMLLVLALLWSPLGGAASSSDRGDRSQIAAGTTQGEL